MIKVGIVGLGERGVSLLSTVRSMPGVHVVGVVAPAGYVLRVFERHAGVRVFASAEQLLDERRPDVVVLGGDADYETVERVLAAGASVFCHRPSSLSGEQMVELARIARARGLAVQAMDQHRFVGVFAEAQRLLAAIGDVVAVEAESGSEDRQRVEAPQPVGVATWLMESAARVAVAEPRRDLSPRVTVRGTRGRIVVDRFELQVLLQADAVAPDGYEVGWNVLYAEDLADVVWEEEYLAQLRGVFDRSADARLEAARRWEALARSQAVMRKVAGEARPAAVAAPGPVSSARAFLAGTWVAAHRRIGLMMRTRGVCGQAMGAPAA
ncbi:MAG: Gfo/Idh/MocA family oxidoreductase [Arachnia sp.]